MPLTTAINSMSFKDTDEKRSKRSERWKYRNYNDNKTNEVIKNFFNHFFLDIKLA